jgi:hypothetical protein
MSRLMPQMTAKTSPSKNMHHTKLIITIEAETLLPQNPTLTAAHQEDATALILWKLQNTSEIYKSLSAMNAHHISTKIELTPVK